MNSMAVYDVTVVGAGMFGSSAAKHIKEYDSSLRVCLIGPKEPKDPREAEIHSSHYDESRICRPFERNLIRGELARRSVGRFRDIEEKTGISLFHEVGFLAVGSTDGSFIDVYKEGADSAKQEYELVPTTQALHAKWSYMDFGVGQRGIYTLSQCGYMNPRGFVKAQKELAVRLGCHVLEDVVLSVQKEEAGCTEYHIKTEKGLTLTSRKVLLCTGAFTHCRDLLPRDLHPGMLLDPNAVLRVEISSEQLSIFKDMPTVSYKGGPWDRPGLNFVAYIVPPVKYPDGKYFLKMGHGLCAPYPVDSSSPHAIRNWYWYGGHPILTEQLLDVTRSLFPGLNMDKYTVDYAVTTVTASGYPYIDLIESTLGLAIGGCGQGAKSADEVGRMAARMIIKGRWDHDLSEHFFKFRATTPHMTAKY